VLDLVNWKSGTAEEHKFSGDDVPVSAVGAGALNGEPSGRSRLTR